MDTPSTTQANGKGRYLVFMDPESYGKNESDIYQKVGARCMSSKDSCGTEEPAEDLAILLDSLGVAFVNMPRNLLEKKFGANNVMGDLKMQLPKSIVHVASSGTASGIVGALNNGQETWGRKAVHAPAAAPTGSGVKVCIVDSGIDTDHPDFVRRPNTTLRGFPRDSMVEDFFGHGTHCAGIICGPARPALPASPSSPVPAPRYGVAPGVHLFVANVFGASADTTTARVMSAVEWAISQECDIVSMSLQAEEDASTPEFAKDVLKFEELAQRALKLGTLLVACTGNASNRDGGRVESAAFPARCPSVLAVGGVDDHFSVMSMSNAGAEVFAPGDVIRSSTINGNYGVLSGTSMAAAFVAGVAALYAERDPMLRGEELLKKLKNSGGRKVALPATELGATLVKAPLTRRRP
jgi:subtilisin family serine protease